MMFPSRRRPERANVVPVAILIVLGYVSCRPETTPRPERPKLHVGAVLSLSGQNSNYGASAKAGIDLAVEEVNREGINGSALAVVFKDDGGDEARAAEAMQGLIGEYNVPVVIGSAASSVTLRLCGLALREKVVLITPISSASVLTQQCGPYFFRVCPSDVHQARRMAEWIRERHKSVAVLHENTTWASSLCDEFKPLFREAGGDVTHTHFDPQGADYSKVLTDLLALNPDSLYIITQQDAGLRLLATARKMRISVPIYAADIWTTQDFLSKAGPDAEGISALAPADADSDRFRTFETRIRQRYPTMKTRDALKRVVSIDPIYAAYAYDATHIVAHGLRQADSGDTLRKVIAAIDYTGAVGRTRFDGNGDVIRGNFRRYVFNRPAGAGPPVTRQKAAKTN